METVFQHIRRRLYDQKGIDRPKSVGTTEEIMTDVQEKWAELDAVVELAKNRLFLGTLRYGLAKQDCHDNYDYGKEIIRRVQLYFESGNTEYLVDALNFCALEFNYPHIPGAHFKPIDDGEHTPRIK